MSSHRWPFAFYDDAPRFNAESAALVPDADKTN
jgi:hypothetical protein